MILSLPGQARLRLSQTILSHNFSLETFTQKIKERFANQFITNTILLQFISSRQATSHAEFIAMLNNTTLLFERNMLHTKPSMQLVISKSPSEIRTFVLKKAERIISGMNSE